MSTTLVCPVCETRWKIVAGDGGDVARVCPVHSETHRADGWPLCPCCGDDELYSLAVPATVETISACYRCGPVQLGPPNVSEAPGGEPRGAAGDVDVLSG